MNKRIILSLILALTAQLSFATVPDSLKRDVEDYDYLVSFVEENYAPFDAIMQKGYKREYKALKKQLRKQLCKGEADLERAATDYVLWFYTRFDRHIMLESETFQMAEANLAQEAIVKSDSTLLTNPGNFEYAPMPVSCKVDSLTKDFSSEGLDIVPDVIIPLPMSMKLTNNIDEWVKWVAEDLKN